MADDQLWKDTVTKSLGAIEATLGHIREDLKKGDESFAAHDERLRNCEETGRSTSQKLNDVERDCKEKYASLASSQASGLSGKQVTGISAGWAGGIVGILELLKWLITGRV